jgi:WD40 repeat protein
VHLIDAYSGTVRASYRPFNNLDEMESPTVVTFSSNGQRIFTGGFKTDRCIHVFDLAVPGRVSTILRLGKTRRSPDGQKGLVSCIASSPLNEKIFSVGTYSPGSLYMYDDRAGQQPSGTILNGVCIVGHGKNHVRKKRRFAGMESDAAEHAIENSNNATTASSSSDGWLGQAKSKWFHTRAQGGVTQVQFSPVQDYILYSASRRSGAVLCWDLRMLSDNAEYKSNCPIQGIGSFATCNDTNQRLEFDLDDTGERLYIGGVDCRVRIYETKSGDAKGEIANLQDAANGVSFCKQQQDFMNGKRLMAVATGSRRFPLQEGDFNRDDNKNTDDVIPSLAPLVPDPAPGYLRLFELTRDGDVDTEAEADGKKEKDLVH